MEFEYWWFLIFPLFFGLGWLAARVDIRHLLSESRSVPASYFKGLNFLLNEQPDKAIEAFLDAAKSGTETIDLQFALGGLFRRRGEVERAIRMHQSLLDRVDLIEDQRLAALYELAQDYLKAGLFDRAEQMFGQLLDTHYAKQAYDSLLEIYVREKDWLKAVETAHELETISDQSYAKEISQFYCEMAAGESLHGNATKARAYLEAALESNRKSVRANMMLGDLETAQSQHERAIEAWNKIEMQSPSHLSLVAERLLAGYSELGKAVEGLALLRGYLERYPSLDLLSVVYQSSWKVKAQQRPTKWCETNYAAIRHCSAWINYWRRSWWRRRRNVGRICSSSRIWCISTRNDLPCISAIIAVLKPGNSIGIVRHAVAGIPTRHAGAKNA
jgi:lipopolysaccharide biosynthesis regulator YciM